MSSPSSWLAGTDAALRPPPKLTLSEWADKYFRLSGSSADAGKWHTRPYQRGIMDAITNPAVERVSVIKSARVGWTQMMNATIGYFIDWDACPILVVQPTVETAEVYSREMIAPMLRDVPVLAELVGDSAAVKTTARTLLHKTFPGGVLSIVGANSGTGFAMIDRRVVAFDEVDRYPPSAGDEGDPISLGEKRTETYWNRKIIAGSTPLIAGASRIEELFLAGDQRRYHVPCPHCGHMDFLRFNVARGGEDDPADDRGHLMRWPKDRPEEACFSCRACGCDIEERHKEAMIEAGEWRADGKFLRHASFHIWSAYSTSPNAAWGDIAARFVAAKRLGPEKLKTVINTDIGETWKEKGEAPEWERLHQRREPYTIGTVPEGVIVLTCGVDVQKDRLVPEVVGWGANKESWSISIDEIHGDTALLTGDKSPWVGLTELLNRAFLGAEGRVFTISMMAVDSGYNAQVVYAWCRQYPRSRVMACKGVGGARALVDAATPVDVTLGGKRIQRGYRVWPVGVDIAKAELYGWLRLRIGEDGEVPPGYCHFPEHGEAYFGQLTAEHLVTIVNRRTRRAKHEWQVLPNRENHYLDARILARAAAAVLGIDRMAPPKAPAATASTAVPSERVVTRPDVTRPDVEHPTEAPRAAPPRPSIWTSNRPRGGWLGRRR
jgi:phage terminase large subunit GpA-like protein